MNIPVIIKFKSPFTQVTIRFSTIVALVCVLLSVLFSSFAGHFFQKMNSTFDPIMGNSINAVCNKLGVNYERYKMYIESQIIICDHEVIDMDYLTSEIVKATDGDKFVYVDGIERNMFILHVFTHKFKLGAV